MSDNGDTLRPSTINWAFQRVLASTKQLPSPPEVCLAVTSAAHDAGTSLDQLQQLVESDIALSARLMQIANSAFFGAREPVSAVRRAIILLGFNTVRTLALGFFFHREFGKLQLSGLPYPDLPRFALACSALAETLAQRAEPALASEAASLGLLHESGTIVLAMAFGRQYRTLLSERAQLRLPLWQAESRAFGLDHAGAAKLLLRRWRLAEPFVQAVAYHHADALPPDAPPQTEPLWRLLQTAQTAAPVLLGSADPEQCAAAVATARARLNYDAPALLAALVQARQLYQARAAVFALPEDASEPDFTALLRLRYP